MQARGPQVPEVAKQGPDTQAPQWAWVEASIWSERMLAALGNGVQGGKWFSLIDKGVPRDDAASGVAAGQSQPRSGRGGPAKRGGLRAPR